MSQADELNLDLILATPLKITICNQVYEVVDPGVERMVGLVQIAEGLTKGKEIIGSGSLGRIGSDSGIAQALELPKGAAKIISGKTSARKILEITGLPESDIMQRLTGALEEH